MEAKSIEQIVELAANEMQTSGKHSSSAFMAVLRGIDRINNMRGGLMISFGKHAGATWKELPEDYRTWLTEQIRAYCAVAELTVLLK